MAYGDVGEVEGMNELESAIQGLNDEIGAIKDELRGMGDAEVGEISDEIGASGYPGVKRRQARRAKNLDPYFTALNKRLTTVEGALRSLKALQQKVVSNAQSAEIANADIMIYQSSYTCTGAAGSYSPVFSASQVTTKFGWVCFYSASAFSMTITKVGATPVSDPGGTIQIPANTKIWLRMAPRILTNGNAAQITATTTATNQVIEMYAVPASRNPEYYVLGSANS